MQKAIFDSIKADPEYGQLVASRRRFSFTLTALMAFAYLGFVLLVALAPDVLAHPLHAGATTSVGIIAGVGIILFSIGLTGSYILHVNRTLDPRMSVLLTKAMQGA